MRVRLAGLFVAAEVGHFARPQFYVSAMPPYLPWPLELVYASGVIEIVLGVLLVVPLTRRFAAWGLIAVGAVFPTMPPAVPWTRLPPQGVFIALAWWFTRRHALRTVDRNDRLG